jgi:hypothetical protein
MSMRSSSEATFELVVANRGGPAYAAVVNFEIKDSAGNKVEQQFAADQKLDTVQTRTFRFAWTPKEKGQFRIDAGARLALQTRPRGWPCSRVGAVNRRLSPTRPPCSPIEIAALLTRQQRPGHHAGLRTARAVPQSSAAGCPPRSAECRRSAGSRRAAARRRWACTRRPGCSAPCCRCRCAGRGPGTRCSA